MSGAEMFNLILIAALMAAIVAYALIKSHLADSKKVTDGGAQEREAVKAHLEGVMRIYGDGKPLKALRRAKLKPLGRSGVLIVKPVKREPHT